MKDIYINADEPSETRKAKAILRKIAYTARQQGLEHEFHHDKIKLDEKWYTIDDIDEIPQKFQPLNPTIQGAVGPHPNTEEMEKRKYG